LTSEIVSFISVALAFVAVSVATWQARSNLRNAWHSHSHPVIAEIFREFRSPGFRESLRDLLNSSTGDSYVGGFRSLPKDRRDAAYDVCYFFEYIGELVAFGIVQEDIIIAAMGTHIMLVWLVMQPTIENERAHRERTFPPDVPPGFLTQYEHLVARIYDLGGGDAATLIQKRRGVRRLAAMTGEKRGSQFSTINKNAETTNKSYE
jgi:hypothetical protein